MHADAGGLTDAFQRQLTRWRIAGRTEPAGPIRRGRSIWKILDTFEATNEADAHGGAEFNDFDIMSRTEAAASTLQKERRGIAPYEDLDNMRFAYQKTALSHLLLEGCCEAG